VRFAQNHRDAPARGRRIALASVDMDFAKGQLGLLLVGAYQHPSGQIPAYEWNFSDVNPPVHAWVTIFLYRTEQALRGKTDLELLRRVFGKLTWNFGWWANRVEPGAVCDQR